MARKPRLEIEGGLYHVITRGNDRRDIFHSDEDFARFVSLLGGLKKKLPFYLYAYCLMTNHVHLLIERRTDSLGRIMQRLLTGYTNYYNRRYRRVGHLLQGRYKSILCESDVYLAQLVRYIHLNPVRANMVAVPEEYPHSSHCRYLGVEPAAFVDVDPVLRKFAARRKVARDRFAQFAAEGIRLGYVEEFYAPEHDLLGSEEFVDDMIHRVGEPENAKRVPRPTDGRLPTQPANLDEDKLLKAFEEVVSIDRSEFFGSNKSARSVAAKETLIVAGRTLGAGLHTLAKLTGLDPSTVSRRYDAARRRATNTDASQDLAQRVIMMYKARERGGNRKLQA